MACVLLAVENGLLRSGCAQILRTAGHSVVEIRRPVDLLAAARVIRCEVCCFDDTQLGRDSLIVSRGVETMMGIIHIGDRPLAGAVNVPLPLNAEALLTAIDTVAPPLFPQSYHEGLVLDRERRAARANGREVWLTRTETRLLGLLIERQPTSVSMAEALRDVWGYEEVEVDPELVRTHVRRLRRKLGELGFVDAVQSQRGHGYRLVT